MRAGAKPALIGSYVGFFNPAQLYDVGFHLNSTAA